MKNKKVLGAVFAIFAAVFVIFAGVSSGDWSDEDDKKKESTKPVTNTIVENYKTDLNEIPSFSGEPYCVINGNVPIFEYENQDKKYFENYTALDNMGRCGEAFACLGIETMPIEERGEIGSVKPSGWVTAKYDFVDGKYLYNRCHLIGFQLSGENANERNLITGTRYMNVQGMLPFENMVADYIKETGNHVLYRVTPVFKDYELVARGVQMEAFSVEDDGEGICFNVYCYNNQPGVSIDYATGNSEIAPIEETDEQGSSENEVYILNTGSKKIHLPTCSSVKDMSEKNKQEYRGDKELLTAQGYDLCGSCNP